MKCDSGKHEWINPICRDRCCKPEWKRVIALNGKHQHLEKDGRVYTDDGVFVHGWIKLKPQTDKP